MVAKPKGLVRGKNVHSTEATKFDNVVDLELYFEIINKKLVCRVDHARSWNLQCRVADELIQCVKDCCYLFGASEILL